MSFPDFPIVIALSKPPAKKFSPTRRLMKHKQDGRPLLRFGILRQVYLALLFSVEQQAAMGRNPPGFTNRLLIVKADSGLLNGLGHAV